VLPGWYGVETALEGYAIGEDQLACLKKMYQHWPFFRTMMDNAQISLGKADMDIAGLYANLAEDRKVRERIFGDILAEYDPHVTGSCVLPGKGKSWTTSRYYGVRSVCGTLRRPFGLLQVSLLRRLHALPNPEGPEADRRALFLTINGIAAGIKNTG
jgi:phosphoenolpyruvate carboxylase